MHPVGKLDDDNPDILRHGHEHFPQVLRLLLLPGRVGDLAQLGHPIDEQGHLTAKPLLDLLDGAVGIFHHVVEQPRHNRLGVHAKANQDGRHRQGVDDIRLSRAAFLLPVLFFRQAVGSLDLFPVVLLAAVLDDLLQLFKAADLHHQCHGASLL